MSGHPGLRPASGQLVGFSFSADRILISGKEGRSQAAGLPQLVVALLEGLEIDDRQGSRSRFLKAVTVSCRVAFASASSIGSSWPAYS